MSNYNSPPDFDELYRDERSMEQLPMLTPWDIGEPQPAVRELVAYGALRGEVLDPGTGPGHHAIYYAAKGHPTTGIDSSPAAIERARRNAARSGVAVNFHVGDIGRLDGFDDRFDTVVDSACYHVFSGDEPAQSRYLQALHRTTRSGARLFMFEFSPHNVNGWQWYGLPESNFRRVFATSGWHLDYLGTTTYQANITAQTFEYMAQCQGVSDWADSVKPVLQRFKVLEPLLDHHRVHLPMWVVHATRLD